MKTVRESLWLEILKLAGPLILSMTGLMLMQFVDALFLSWYSADAIGAVVPAGMASYLMISVFQGTSGYSSTFVAHYVGAGREQRAYAATWQATYFAVAAGVVVGFLGFLGKPIFAWVGHGPSVQVLEQRYFEIMCWGAITAIASSGLSGFFSGKGKTHVLMAVQLGGFAVNAVLDYALIFGAWGFPRWGITGAAVATVIAQAFNTLMLLALFLFCEKSARPWQQRSLEWPLLARMVRFGLPNGLRFGFEMLAWTAFIFFVGRIGTAELAASNIAFRINGFAFFPIVGLGQAVGILVGQAQGRHDWQRTIRLTHTGLYISEVWMVLAALSFILFPREIFGLFRGDQYGALEFAAIAEAGTVILRFVALYSLFDACNIIFVGSLQSAGDTRWTLVLSLAIHAVFLTALTLADHFRLGLRWEWGFATVFVMVAALFWMLRFRTGKWRSIRVIEHAPELEV